MIPKTLTHVISKRNSYVLLVCWHSKTPWWNWIKSITISFFIDLWQKSSFEKIPKKEKNPHFIQNFNPNIWISRPRFTKWVVKGVRKMRPKNASPLWLSAVHVLLGRTAKSYSIQSVDIISPSWKTEDRSVLCVNSSLLWWF